MRCAGALLFSLPSHSTLALHQLPHRRRHWEEESGKRGDRFNVGEALGKRGADHEMLHSRAASLYETLFGGGKGVGRAPFVPNLAPRSEMSYVCQGQKRSAPAPAQAEESSEKGSFNCVFSKCTCIARLWYFYRAGFGKGKKQRKGDKAATSNVGGGKAWAKCFNCNETGHMAKNCPRLKKQSW